VRTDAAVEALIDEGVRLGQLGRWQDAVAVYDRLHSLDPAVWAARTAARALVNQSVALWHVGRSKDAVAACMSALALDDHHFPDDEVHKQMRVAMVYIGVALGEPDGPQGEARS
jgi:hypothetical protein